MKSLIITFLLFSYVVSDFSSQTYQNLSSKAKMDSLWNKITENETPLEFYGAGKQATIFIENMKDSFDVTGDEFQNGRLKLIHTVGRIAKAEFISSGDHGYSGVFEGSTQLLVRFSCAKEPDYKKSTAEGAFDNFTPGMALKFLRDGHPSANLQAMFSVNGQSSWNFFKNDFSNHVESGIGFALKALALKFSSATDYVQTMGLRDLAIINEKGGIRSPAKYPFKLIFRPTPDVKNRVPDNFTVDYMTQLGSITSGTTIYEVYAIDQPTQKEKKIGIIKTTSKMASSHWGDESLFFRHNYMDADLKENPSWTNYVPKFSIFGSSNTTEGEKKKCPFLH